jgi:hypothetical protein
MWMQLIGIKNIYKWISTMRQIKNIRTVVTLFLGIILVVSLQFACKEKTPQQTQQTTFTIKRIQDSKINVNDYSLAEWDSSFVILRITPQLAIENQWKRIGEKITPQLLDKKNIDIKVYMARDSAFLYIASEILDGNILSVPSNSIYPYSGDCLEVFFAGDSLNSAFDINDIIKYSTSPNQSIFYQLQLPAVALEDSSYYLSYFRTDSTFKKNAFKSGFHVSIWKSDSLWSAEARIPIHAFEPQVVDRIKNHEPLKMNINYLDYDTKTAKWIKEDNWGFKPDNVFCPDTSEIHVNRPKFMRSVIFQ